MLSLCVAVPNGGTIKTKTVNSLISLVTLHIPIYFSFPISGYSPYNRNQSVEQAKKMNATHIMFIDNDMIFTPQDVQTLIDHKKAVIGAKYHLRDRDGYATMFWRDGAYVMSDGQEKGLFSCASIGTGFMLVDMGVFKKIEKPYFDTKFVGDTLNTEDVEFCKKCLLAGIEIWCDNDRSIGHIGTKIY